MLAVRHGTRGSVIADTVGRMHLEGPSVLDDSVEYMINEYRARHFWERREYRAAMDEAAEAAGKAHGNGDEQAYWRMSLLMAECQLELGLIQEFATSAKVLAEDPTIRKNPTMEARAKAVHARALQCLGLVGEALAVAKEAAAIELSESGDGQSHFDTHHALIASLAETGKLEEAWEMGQSMLKLVNPQTPQETAGLAYWAIGNVAFLMENNIEGSMWHDRAAVCLSPTNDVNLWALFNKASAHVRIQANLVEPATLECIERAELAISVTGGSPVDELEISLVRSNWLLLTGQPQESLQRLEGILIQRDLLPTHILAETEQLMASAFFELGRFDEALSSALHSEKTFTVLGAFRRADLSRKIIDNIEAGIR